MADWMNPYDMETAQQVTPMDVRHRLRRSAADRMFDVGEGDRRAVLSGRLAGLQREFQQGYGAFGGHTPGPEGKVWDWARLQQAIPALNAAVAGRAPTMGPMPAPRMPSFIAEDRIGEASRRIGALQAARGQQDTLDQSNELSRAYSEGEIGSGTVDRTRRRRALAGLIGR